MAWTSDPAVALGFSRHTVSASPDPASASALPAGRDASTEVCAGTVGSGTHCGATPAVPGRVTVAARPPASSTHAPAPGSVPAAVIEPETGSGRDVRRTREVDGGEAGAEPGYPVHPVPSQSAASPALPSTRAGPAVNRTSWPDTGSLFRCHPLPGE